MMCDSPEQSNSSLLASLPEAESMYNQKYSPSRCEPHPYDDFLDGMMESDEDDATHTKITPSSRSGDLSPVLEHEKEQSLKMPSRSYHSGMRRAVIAKDVAPTYDTRVSPTLKSILRNKYSNSKASQSQPQLDTSLSDFFDSEPDHTFHNPNSAIPNNSISSVPTIVSMEDEAWNSSLNSFQSAGSGTSAVVFDECVHVKEFVPIERPKYKSRVWYTRNELAKMERKAALKILKHSKKCADLDESQHSESSSHSASGKAFYTHPAMTIDAEDDDDSTRRFHKRKGTRFMKKMMRRISM